MLRVKCPRKLFNSDSSSSVPLLSLRNVVSSTFTFFLRLLQAKAQHCVPNFPIFLTAYNNYVAKGVSPIWRRLNFAGFIFCPSLHISCSIQSYSSDHWWRVPDYRNSFIALLKRTFLRSEWGAERNTISIVSSNTKRNNWKDILLRLKLGSLILLLAVLLPRRLWCTALPRVGRVEVMRKLYFAA